MGRSSERRATSAFCVCLTYTSSYESAASKAKQEKQKRQCPLFFCARSRLLCAEAIVSAPCPPRMLPVLLSFGRRFPSLMDQIVFHVRVYPRFRRSYSVCPVSPPWLGPCCLFLLTVADRPRSTKTSVASNRNRIETELHEMELNETELNETETRWETSSPRGTGRRGCAASSCPRRTCPSPIRASART